MKKENGFTLVEGLLILLLVSFMGFAGWYVWHSQKAEPKDTAAVAKTSPKPPTDTNKTDTDETAGWLLYEAPGKEYKIRLADGWKLERGLDDGNDFIYAWSAKNITYSKGQKAAVTDQLGGRDGDSIAFSLSALNASDNMYIQGDLQTGFKTKQGLEVKKYLFTQTEELEGIGLRKGSSEYTYVVTKGEAAVKIIHDVNPGDPDLMALVEQVVKTVEL